MTISAEQLKKDVAHGLAIELDDAIDCIQHCVGQLSESQVWMRPNDAMNSVGNLLLHVCGNIRQWIIAGVGGVPDTRKRQAEFDERGPIAKSELLRQLIGVVEEAKRTIEFSLPERWAQPLTVQGFSVTGAAALIHSVAHLRGHTQEIVHMTRTLVGDRYQFKFVPTTPEQGATT